MNKIIILKRVKGWIIKMDSKIVVWIEGNVPGVRGSEIIGFMEKSELIMQERGRFDTKKPIKYFESEEEANDWKGEFVEKWNSL